MAQLPYKIYSIKFYREWPNLNTVKILFCKVAVPLVKGVCSRTCRIGLVNRKKKKKKKKKNQKLLDESGIALFGVPNISTFMNNTYSHVLILFSCVIWC